MLRTNLTVYNMLGQKVLELLNENYSPGEYEVKLNAEGLSSGVYVYRLVSGENVLSRKMALIK